MAENRYQAKLIKKLKDLYPGCVIQKNDPSYTQGFPDLLILFGSRWAALEVKDSWNSPRQPNQEYWVDYLNQLSYAAFISPETEEGVLYELQQALRPQR